jgi:chromosome segregation ATPase
MSDHNDRVLREAMMRLLAGDAQRTDGRLTVANLAAEAGLTRQQAYRSSVIDAWREAIRDLEPAQHPDMTQARIERLTQDLAASQERARRYRLERDEARARTQTLANACRALDQENDGLRTALSAARVVTTLPSRTGHNHQRTRPAPG